MTHAGLTVCPPASRTTSPPPRPAARPGLNRLPAGVSHHITAATTGGAAGAQPFTRWRLAPHYRRWRCGGGVDDGVHAQRAASQPSQ
ncbi:hypothetical protein [Candidatus Sodalis sp. SoCistrobi]|uniref:hypothetical protein n=1 Tax=Candidatus Sodalis sp. SoCistrobi TaxID=1922216 RepID=UPI00093B0DD7|nr:hypothetical protein [Candidatus Sodalis sp. SoCistrobi]